MSLAKRTYSLPPDVVERFETRVSAGERSPVLARLLSDWVEEQEREELRQQILEGCKEMAELYDEVDREWAAASDEVWRVRR